VLALSHAAAAAPACRDAALLLLLAGHGADAPPAAAPSPAASRDDGPHATLRTLCSAALERVAADISNAHHGYYATARRPAAAAAARLLRARACGLLTLWLHLGLPLPRLPCSLFLIDANSAPEGGATATPLRTPPLPRLVRSLYAPLCAAAALASDPNTLSFTASTLGLDGGSSAALSLALPEVLGAVLPLQQSSDGPERHLAAVALEFVRQRLAPALLTDAVKEQHAAVIASLVCRASAAAAAVAPRQPVARVLAALESETALRTPTLKAALVGMPPAQLHDLVLRAHAAAVGAAPTSGSLLRGGGEEIEAGGADLAPLELLLSHGLLSDATLRRAAVPHLLQAALLHVLALSAPPTLGLGVVNGDAGAAAARCERAGELLIQLHSTMPDEVRAGLLRAALRTCVPCAAAGARPASAVLATLLPSPLPPALVPPLSLLPPLAPQLSEPLCAGLAALVAAQQVARPEAERAAEAAGAASGGLLSATGGSVGGVGVGDGSAAEASLVARELAFCATFDETWPGARAELRGALSHCGRLLRSPWRVRSLPLDTLDATRGWLLALLRAGPPHAHPIPPRLAEAAAHCLGLLGPPLGAGPRPAPLTLLPPPTGLAATHPLALWALHACLLSGGCAPAAPLCASLALGGIFDGASGELARGAAIAAMQTLRRSPNPAQRSAAFHLQEYLSAGSASSAVGGGAVTLHTVGASSAAAVYPVTSHTVGGGAVTSHAVGATDVSMWRGGGSHPGGAWVCVCAAALLRSCSDGLLAACAPVAEANVALARTLLGPAMQSVTSQPRRAAALAAVMSAAYGSPPPRGSASLNCSGGVSDGAAWREWKGATRLSLEVLVWLSARGEAGRCLGTHDSEEEEEEEGDGCAMDTEESVSAEGAREFWREMDLSRAAEAAVRVGANATALFLLELRRASPLAAVQTHQRAGNGQPAPEGEEGRRERAVEAAAAARLGLFGEASPALLSPRGAPLLLRSHLGGSGLADGIALAALDAAFRTGGSASADPMTGACASRAGRGVLAPLLKRGCFALAASHLAWQSSEGHGAPAAAAEEVAWRLGQWGGAGGAEAAQRHAGAAASFGGAGGALAAALDSLSLLGSAADPTASASASAASAAATAARSSLCLLGRSHPESVTAALPQLSALAQCAALRSAAAALGRADPTNPGFAFASASQHPCASQGASQAPFCSSQAGGERRSFADAWRPLMDATLSQLDSSFSPADRIVVRTLSIYLDIYISMYVCVCVCVYLFVYGRVLVLTAHYMDEADVWHLHDIVMTNNVWCIAYTREVGRGALYCPIIVQ